MNLPQRSPARKRARKRGVAALEELFSMAALMACFVGPIAVAARSVGPQLANEMDHRIHQVSAQDPGAAPANANAGGGLDFGSAFGGSQR